MSPTLAIENISISQIRIHSSNPRKHSKKQIKQIAESIRTFGFKVPVLVDSDNRLICGHGRVAACRLLGLDTVPAIRATDLDEAQIRAYMIADNRLTEISEWDDSLLAENFDFLTDSIPDFSLEVTGFDYGDIEEFLIRDEDAVGAEPPTPDSSTVPSVARVGDLWQLGKHRIICGDSLDPDTYRKLFGKGEKASMIFTDPPYNLSAREISQTCGKNHGDFAMGAGEMSSDQFAVFLGSIFTLLTAHSKNGSIHYVCMDWRHAQEILAAGRRCYGELKNICVWAKKCGRHGHFLPQPARIRLRFQKRDGETSESLQARATRENPDQRLELSIGDASERRGWGQSRQGSTEVTSHHQTGRTDRRRIAGLFSQK